MNSSTDRLAQTRFDNAMTLFDEFVRSNVKHADAATLRGLEGRFALRLQVQPSYWSQIKSRSRQIGERLARQFERLCRKPPGWMDEPHDVVGQSVDVLQHTDSQEGGARLEEPKRLADDDFGVPADDDERFIVGLVLTYYRRHPQRARSRLLELLGEVLVSQAAPAGGTSGARAAPPATTPRLPLRSQVAINTPADESGALWASSRAGVAPLKQKS